MRVLHLLANHKWTGPAEPALLVAERLARSGEVEVVFALAGFVHEGLEHAVARRAAELGLTVLEGLSLRKHVRPLPLFADVARLRDLARDFDVVHCHLPADHLSAALAFAGGGPAVVRSLWAARAPRPGPRALLAFGATAGVHVCLEGAAAGLPALGVARGRIVRTPPPLDGTLPRRARAGAAFRARIGVPAGVPLVGLTARIQARRRWDLFAEVVAAARAQRPELRFAVLGRPDAGVFERLCRRPLAERGVAQAVAFPGYLAGADYAAALAALDAFLFLVPGSDPTCRALREARLFGLPVVCSDLEPLPELVADGRDGLVRPPAAAPLAEALLTVLEDRAFAARLGEAGRRRALAEAEGAELVRALVALYRGLVAERQP